VGREEWGSRSGAACEIKPSKARKKNIYRKALQFRGKAAIGGASEQQRKKRSRPQEGFFGKNIARPEETCGLVRMVRRQKGKVS